MRVNRQIRLVSRPKGEVREDDFQLTTVDAPDDDLLEPGQVLVRHHYLSLDPYMRLRMNDRKNYAPPQPLDAVMLGGTVGEVVASRSERFAVGDAVVGFGGWQDYALLGHEQLMGLRKIDPTQIPLTAHLGPCGMPGVTAWIGLTEILKPRARETIVVSAASGAVGSVVGQLAKARGCRVVGIAGGVAKCAYVVDELGFDACVDYKAHATPGALDAALGEACPDGIDGNFENVGGDILNAVMPQMNDFGRIACCGFIAEYDDGATPMTRPSLILTARLKVQGFIVSEHPDLWPPAMAELQDRVRSGRLRYRETGAQGLQLAPVAFIGMLKGANFGKQLVRLTS